MEYYTIPLQVNKIMKGKRVYNDIELRHSIHQNISMILKGFSLSYRFDPTYGCIMNKYHAFTPPQHISERIWRESLRELIQKNLKDLFQRYETRVKISNLTVEMEQPKISDKNSMVLVKVELSGKLTIGRKEMFHFPDSEIADEAQEVFPMMLPVGKISI